MLAMDPKATRLFRKRALSLTSIASKLGSYIYGVQFMLTRPKHIEQPDNNPAKFATIDQSDWHSMSSFPLDQELH